jgi:hypothetical protein
VQIQTGVPAQDLGGGGTVGSGRAVNSEGTGQTKKFQQVLNGSSRAQRAKPCTAVCKQSVNPKKQKAQPVRAGLSA